MFVSDKIVFIELQKTGCTHIQKLLSSVVEGAVIGKHNLPAEDLFSRDVCFVGSIRDPWEWYVSLWAYGCDKKGGVYELVTRARNLKELLVIRDPKRSGILLFRELLRMPDEWKSLYTESNDVISFRNWLRRMYAAKYRYDFGEGYGFSPIHPFAGLLTYRYLLLFCRNTERLFSKQMNNYSTLKAFEESNIYINYIIRNENLEDDFIDVLARCGVTVTDEQKKEIYDAQKTNASSRVHGPEFYYDEETIELVAQRERLIIEKYGYRPPVIHSDRKST